jgi:hypothetical protein
MRRPLFNLFAHVPGRSRNAGTKGTRTARQTITIMLAATLSLTGVAPIAFGAEPAGILLQQISSAHQQNYDALERAPIRHWGELNQLGPWNDLRHALAVPARAARSHLQSSEAVGQRFNAIYADFVEQLRLTPAGDLLVGKEGGITTVPQTVQCTAFVDVPTALVLRVKASDRTGWCGNQRANAHTHRITDTVCGPAVDGLGRAGATRPGPASLLRRTSGGDPSGY